MPRYVLFASIVVLSYLALACAPTVSLADSDDHFSYFGLMSQSLPNGVAPGPVTAGIPVHIPIAVSGPTPAHVSLKAAGWTGPAILTVSSLRGADGHLAASLSLKNDTGFVLEGVRLDIGNASAASGGASIASPLYFGDIAIGDSTGALPLDVSGIASGATGVDGVLSGLTLAKTISVDDAGGLCEGDVDEKGNVYVMDTGNNRVLMMGPDGENVTTIVKTPSGIMGYALNPSTGEQYAVCANQSFVFKYTSAGSPDGKFDASGYPQIPSVLRVDHNGTLYGGGSGGSILEIASDGSVSTEIAKVGGNDISSLGFCVAQDGSIYECDGGSGNVMKISPDHKTASIIAGGPDWHMSKVMSPNEVRLAPNGLVYIVDRGDGTNNPRVSVFDSNGGFIRVFGFGGGSRLPLGARRVGQLPMGPNDVVFGAGGRIYVTPGTSDTVIDEFRPF